MNPEITMRELVILVLCFVLYVVAVEVYEAREDVARQGHIQEQEQSFVYLPAEKPTAENGLTIEIDNSG